MANVAMLQQSGPVTSYSNIALAGSCKQGILKKLDNGYCEIILGAFAAFGNGGWLYDARTAMRYIEQDRDFLALLQSGRLRSEWGHPRRLPGMTDQDWFIRICEIMENNVSSHIRKISVSMNTVRDERGRMVVAVIGEVRPSGPHEGSFQRMLDNPDEDVNYSIRCFANKNFKMMTKHINRIITWDSVFDPGIKVATKYKTPSLESRAVTQVLDDVEFNLDQLRQGLLDPANAASFENMSPFVKVLDGLYEDTRVSIAMPTTLKW